MERNGVPARLTDLYLITILGVFPLFCGFSGYENITLPKHLFFLGATGLWLLALPVSALLGHRPVLRLKAPQWAALALLLICLVSWLVSPNRAEGLVGAGRYDGLLTDAAYVLIFLGVSLLTAPKRRHAAALGVSMTLCCAVAVWQLLGGNPLGLFPEGLGYYDAGILYSGAYLGTVGNTNILDALLCLSLPLFFGLYVRGESAAFLLPLLPGCFVAGCAGGDGAALSFGVCALAAGPLLVTDAACLRRLLRALCAVLLPLGLSFAYTPLYSEGVLTPRLQFTAAAAAAWVAAALCLGGSFLPPGPLDRVSPRSFRRCFFLLDGALVLVGLVWVLRTDATAGTLYELQSLLHGRVSDEFGSSRIRIWRECLALVPERPLLGGGPGTLALRLHIDFSRYVPESGRLLRASVDNAHNVYLGRLVSCGVLGLAADLTLLASAAATALRRAEGSVMIRPLALGAFCAAVHGLFGLGLSLSEPLFWAILGLLCAEGGKGMEETL